MAGRRARRVRAADVLGPLEAEVMGVVWRRSRRSAADVTAEVNARRVRELSYKTILTILTRLEAKGWLSHERDGRAYRYSATVNERALTELQARRAAEALLDKFGDLALQGFVDEVAGDRVRLARLEDLLARRGEASSR